MEKTVPAALRVGNQSSKPAYDFGGGVLPIAYSSACLTGNLIQAQRDYFGAHTYERIDAKGTFHTEWEKE